MLRCALRRWLRDRARVLGLLFRLLGFIGWLGSLALGLAAALLGRSFDPLAEFLEDVVGAFAAWLGLRGWTGLRRRRSLLPASLAEGPDEERHDHHQEDDDEADDFLEFFHSYDSSSADCADCADEKRYRVRKARPVTLFSLDFLSESA